MKNSFEKKTNLDLIDELIQLSANEFKKNSSEIKFVDTKTEKWIDNLINNIQNWIKNDKKVN